MGTMAPVSGQAITLANSIIGVGILAMPFCFKQCGIILSILIILGSGLMSRLACHFLLKSAIVSRRKNFEALAYQVFGSAGKLAVEVGIIGFLMGTCVAYFVVVGDLGPQIIAKMLNLNQSDALRTGVMVVVSVVCVLPLGLLRNVDSLSNVCAATIGFYFCLVLKVILESEGPLFSGEWFDKVEFWDTSGVLQCLPIFSMALFCQTQLFEIYDTLPNATLDKMNIVTKNAVNICSAVYVLMGLFGYIAFCNRPISGNILLSFSPTFASDAIKMGFVMSLAFSFPLIIFPCRASLYSLLYRKGQASHHELLNNLIPEVRFKCLTIGIIIVSLLLGLMLPNIELVLGLVGSTIGVMICVIFPATCFICVSTKNTNERLMAQLVLCFGIVIMVLGTYANLQAVEIDNISIENKIVAESMQNKITDSKILMALSQETLEEKNGDTKLISNIADKGKIVPEQVYKDASKEKPANVDSIILPPNPVAPQEEKVQNEPKVEPKKDTIKQPSVQEKVKEISLIDIPNKDEKEGAGDSEVQVEQNTVTSPQIQVNKIIFSQEHQQPSKLSTEKDVVRSETEDHKKQELMDTIKRHAEEQRQMVIEQQKILQEIKETQKDIEIKQKADVSLSVETKKLAVENIQKIAKMAIESLGGNVDITTHPIVKVIQKDKQVIEKTFHTNIIPNAETKRAKIDDNKRKELPKLNDDHVLMKDNTTKLADVHIHKKDEPESYKAGEENNMKKVATGNLTLSHKDSENLANRPPIAIVMSKANEIKKIEKHIETQPAKTESIKPDTKKVAKTNGNVPQDDYVGGKRDILEVWTVQSVKDTTINDNKVAKVHYRNKRDINDCPGTVVSNNRGLQICKMSEKKDSEEQPQLNKSDVLHANGNILNIAESINNLDPDVYIKNLMNSANIVDFHIRNLKSIKITNSTSAE